MAKINSTFNAGYYMDKNVDFHAFGKEQEDIAKRKEKAKRERLQRIAALSANDPNAMDGVVIDGRREHQTFAVPFHMQCLHCDNRVAKGTHVYMNRYKVQTKGEEKSKLGLTIWEIQFRCTSCSKHVYIRVDYDTPEQTGGYIAHKHCKRFVGDFAELRKKEVAKAKEDAIAAAKLLATMSDAERRGLETKARQEEDRKLEALMKRREDASTDDMLARIAAEGGATNTGNTSSSSADAMALLAAGGGGLADSLLAGYIGGGDDDDGDDDGLWDIDLDENDEDARSASDDSDAEGEGGDNKRAREERIDEGASAAPRHRSEVAALPAPHSLPLPPVDDAGSDNAFLSSLGAVMGMNLAAMAPPPVAAPTPAAVAVASDATAAAPADDLLGGLLGGSSAAPAKKKAAPKLKGKDFLSNFFSS